MTTTSIAVIPAPSAARSTGPLRIIVALLSLTLLAGALGGCGFVQLSYNHATLPIYRWLDGYAGFSDAQTARVRADLDRLHDWHRAEELPRYAQLLERLARAASANLTPAQACSFTHEVRTRLDALLLEAEPAIARIALDFQPEQFRHLERKFAQVNQKYWKKWIDAPLAEQLRDRLERAEQHAQRFYGPLAEPQRALIRARLERGSFDPAATYGEMKRRQRDTIETLRLISRTQPGADAARAAVHGWLDRMQRSPDPHYRAYQDKVMRESCEGIAALHDGTSAAQRAHAVAKLRDWARDLRELGM